MDHKELRDNIHSNAVEKGFWDEPDHDKFLMLIVSEIGEAIEADRAGKRADITGYSLGKGMTDQSKKEAFEMYIKDTIGDELADTIIRIYDFAGGYNFEIEEEPFQYEIASFYKALKKATKQILKMEEWLPNGWKRDTMKDAIAFIKEAARGKGIDIEWHIKEKMNYNEGRERLHVKPL